MLSEQTFAKIREKLGRHAEADFRKLCETVCQEVQPGPDVNLEQAGIKAPDIPKSQTKEEQTDGEQHGVSNAGTPKGLPKDDQQ